MSDANVPNAAQRLEYEKHLKKWQTVLNLNDWRIKLGKRPARKGAMADILPQVPDRLANARLGDFGGEEINSQTLEATALHEILHVFFAPLIHVCLQPDTTLEIVNSVEHSLINTLESLLVPKPEDHDART